MLWIPPNIGQSLVLGMVLRLGDEKLYDDRVTSGSGCELHQSNDLRLYEWKI
jgi:hypothetical protein